MNESEEQVKDDWAIVFNGLLDAHKALEEEIFRLQRLHKRNELFAIILGSIISGGLWVMLGNMAPEATAWSGAVASTLLTAFSAFRYFVNYLDKIKELEMLYEQVGVVLSEMRSNWSKQVFDVVPSRILSRYKGFEAKMVRLGVKPPELWRKVKH
ncbi:hypothetical protein ACP3V3_09275 [Vibrio sp. PNB22_3_1]